MTGALRYEWIRITTVRSTWWLIGLSVVAQGLLALVLTLSGKSHGGPLAADAAALALSGGTGLIPLIFVFMGLIGVFATGHEYRYGTIRTTLTAFPRRTDLWAAKVLVVAALVTVVGGILVAESLGIGLLVGGPTAGEVFTGHQMGRVAAGYVVFLVVCALFGLAFAGIARNVPAAIVLLITLPVIIEGLISLILGMEAFASAPSLSAYLPFTAGERMMAVSAESPFGDGPAPLRPLTGGLVFTLYGAALLALWGALFTKRDA
ncbi:ABC transporter permease [Streptomyces sp. MB09-02B]|uniref:ABC transporter permease n=1 Tax=Streptomyces sp. MB09-02B TaxID=3028667 RepID=UPI0029B6BE21|nr:ABC transporter permease [Streptomyces sp. MB09-02B]MDX3642490.1 ABC transporter permease [Streptomyces sp. MB09-02B]